MTYQAGFADASHGPVWTTATFIGTKIRAFHTSTSPASTAWPQANDAFLIPFVVGTSVTVTNMFFLTGTTPGTTAFDLGIYRDDFTRVASLGTTNCVSTTDAIMPVGGGAFTAPVTLARGRYYMAMSSASTALTVRASVNANNFMRAIGMFKSVTAHPLPTTFTPATNTAAFCPMIGMTTAASVVI